MNLLQVTLLYMFLAMVLMVVVDTVFTKRNFRNYNTLLDSKDKFFLYMVEVSILYLIYVVAYMDFILPLYIIGIGLSIVWLYFFIFDIELKVMSIKDKILILLITLSMITLVYLGFVYILSLGLVKFVRIDLKDTSKIFDINPKIHSLELMSNLEESEIEKYTSILIDLFKSGYIVSIDILKLSIFQVLTNHQDIETITKEFEIKCLEL